jgi:hypothetical protein
MEPHDERQPSNAPESDEKAATESAAVDHGLPAHPDAHRFEARGGSREPTAKEPKE